MTLFNPVFNCLTPKGIKRLKTQTDEGLTPADEAGSVVLRQPPASKLANLFRIDVRDHALGLVTQQLGGRVREHPPGGWLGPRTPSLREGPGSASVPSGSPDPVAGTGACAARPCGRGKLAQFSLLQRFAVWWVAPPWPILSVAAVLLALCRLVECGRPAPRDRVSFGLCQFGCRCQVVASGGGSAHDLTPLGPAGGGRKVASESGGSGVWRVVVSGTRTVASGQWPVASEIEEAETTVIEKRQNKANLPMVLTIGRL